MRVGQLVYLKSLDFVPLGKMRKEQSGDASETEKVAMRSVLGTLGYLARESRPDFRTSFNSAKSSQQGPGVRHTRNQQGGETGQGSHRSCTACLQNSCRSNVFGVLRGCQWWRHTCRTSANRVHDHVCGHVIAGRIGVSCNSGILEISHCETICFQRLCSGGHGFV